MPTYRNADAELGQIVKDAMKEYRPDLAEEKVTVDCLFAVGDLNHHGYAAAAIIKINNQEKRAEGCADLTLVVHHHTWEKNLNDAGKQALLHHELFHPQLQFDKKGRVKTDDCGRPKLKNRVHDWECGGFFDIAERHGENALEVRQLRLLADKHGQLLFGFAADTADREKSKRKKKDAATIIEQQLVERAVEELGVAGIEVEISDGLYEDSEETRKQRQRLIPEMAGAGQSL